MIRSAPVDAGPLVTVGIPTFNRRRGTLPDALHSALGQSYEHLEVVVCDNASDDGTGEFIAAQNDPRLRYHRHTTNIGANANFNACLKLARGDYFLLLPDDDLLDPTFVERAIEAVGDRSPGVALGGVHVVDERGNVLDRVRAPAPELGAAGLFQAWFDRTFSFYLVSTLFGTESLRRAGGFDSPENLFQDVVAIARVASRDGYVPVPGVAGAFRRHDGNRGSAEHALRWTRDSVYLLDVLADELPAHRAPLYTAGAPYLAAKCYRSVSGVASAGERWRLYREIHAQFGHTYAPWRYLMNRFRNRAMSTLRGLARRGRRRFADT